MHLTEMKFDNLCCRNLYQSWRKF